MSDTILVPATHHLFACSEGHEFSVDPSRRPTDRQGHPKPITKCPVYFLGAPCKGTLRRFGAGSRGAK